MIPTISLSVVSQAQDNRLSRLLQPSVKRRILWASAEIVLSTKLKVGRRKMPTWLVFMSEVANQRSEPKFQNSNNSKTSQQRDNTGRDPSHLTVMPPQIRATRGSMMIRIQLGEDWTILKWKIAVTTSHRVSDLPGCQLINKNRAKDIFAMFQDAQLRRSATNPTIATKISKQGNLPGLAAIQGVGSSWELWLSWSSRYVVYRSQHSHHRCNSIKAGQRQLLIETSFHLGNEARAIMSCISLRRTVRKIRGIGSAKSKLYQTPS